MEIINIIILSFIQGVTEFLPISSSAHLVLLSEFSNFPDQGLGFDIALHTGSLLAILIYFKDEIKKRNNFDPVIKENKEIPYLVDQHLLDKNA